MAPDSGFQLLQDSAAAYERETRVFMLPLATVLLDAVDLAPGDHLLDLACGTGVTARAAASRVARMGRVVGADVNPGMIDVAGRSEPTEPPIEWHVASALDLPFDDASFDVVVAQQGVQFFPDLDVALGEMCRVARPGARIAATSWTPLRTSPYLDAQFAALSEVLPAEAMLSFEAAFRLQAGDLASAWDRAGLRGVAVDVRAPEVTLPPLDDYVARHLAATPWGAPFAAVSEDARRQVVDRMAQMLDGFTVRGQVTVPFSTWVVSGTV